jgi:hypothetical protein
MALPSRRPKQSRPSDDEQKVGDRASTEPAGCELKVEGSSPFSRSPKPPRSRRFRRSQADSLADVSPFRVPEFFPSPARPVRGLHRAVRGADLVMKTGRVSACLLTPYQRGRGDAGTGCHERSAMETGSTPARCRSPRQDRPQRRTERRRRATRLVAPAFPRLACRTGGHRARRQRNNEAPSSEKRSRTASRSTGPTPNSLITPVATN